MPQYTRNVLIAVGGLVVVTAAVIVTFVDQRGPLVDEGQNPDKKTTPEFFAPLDPSIESQQPPPDKFVSAPESERDRVPIETSAERPRKLITQVVDSEGKPIGGADVFQFHIGKQQSIATLLELEPDDWQSHFLRHRSDSMGQVVLNSDDLGSKSLLIVRKPGFAWKVIEAQAPESLDLISLDPTLQLDGTVVDIEGNPIEGATAQRSTVVRIDIDEDSPPTKIAEFNFLRETSSTDKNGFFRQVEVPGDPAILSIEAEGFANSVYTDFPPPFEGVFVLSPSATIFGTVCDRKRHPVGNALVKAFANGSLPEPATPWVHTDSEGRYTIKDAQSGSISVAVYTDGRFPVTRVWSYAEAGQEKEINIELSDPTVIAGRVSDKNGTPIPDVQIGVEAMSTGIYITHDTTDEDGRFTIEGVTPGELYRVITLEENQYSPYVQSGIPCPFGKHA